MRGVNKGKVIKRMSSGILEDVYHRSEWHKATVALSYRAEELQNATETFAETIFLDALKAKQNQIISDAAKGILPGLMSFAEKRQAIANNPAGNTSPDPKAIIVDDVMFKVLHVFRTVSGLQPSSLATWAWLFPDFTRRTISNRRRR